MQVGIAGHKRRKTGLESGMLDAENASLDRRKMEYKMGEMECLDGKMEFDAGNSQNARCLG